MATRLELDVAVSPSEAPLSPLGISAIHRDIAFIDRYVAEAGGLTIRLGDATPTYTPPDPLSRSLGSMITELRSVDVGARVKELYAPHFRGLEEQLAVYTGRKMQAPEHLTRQVKHMTRDRDDMRASLQSRFDSFLRQLAIEYTVTASPSLRLALSEPTVTVGTVRRAWVLSGRRGVAAILPSQ